MSYPASVVGGVGVGCAVVGAAIPVVVSLLVGYRRLEKKRKEDEARWARTEAYANDPNRISGAYACVGFAKDNAAYLPDTHFVHDLEQTQRNLLMSMKSIVDRLDLTSLPDDLDTSSWASLASPHADWARMPSLSPRRRSDVLLHFLGRFLYSRMIPEGDPATTLLPPDMLSTYQRIMSKPQSGLSARHNAPPRHIRTANHMRHYWRALTAHFSSDVVRQLDVWTVGFECPDNDPRKPQLALAEDTLVRFFSTWKRSSWVRENSEGLRGAIERALFKAANIALLAFASPEPVKMFWAPEADRSELPPPDDGDDDHTHDKLWPLLFGLSMKNRVPGEELENMDDDWVFLLRDIQIFPPIDSGSEHRRDARVNALRRRKAAEQGVEPTSEGMGQEYFDVDQLVGWNEDETPNPALAQLLNAGVV